MWWILDEDVGGNVEMRRRQERAVSQTGLMPTGSDCSFSSGGPVLRTRYDGEDQIAYRSSFTVSVHVQILIFQAGQSTTPGYGRMYRARRSFDELQLSAASYCSV